MNQYRANTLYRVLKSGFVNLFRNLWLTIAATAVMLVALIIISIGVVINVTTSNAIDVLSRELKTAIFLDEDITREQRSELEQEIRGMDFVATVQYVSPSEAQSRLTADPTIGAEVLQASALFEGADFLAPSFEVALNDLTRASELAQLADNPDYEAVIDRVALGKTDTGAQTDAEKAIERAADTERFITVSSIVAAGSLSAVSIMIIFNTIRMAIYTRRDEISIMKLIGATPNYIRGPFLVEASLYGVMAGIIASSALYTLIYTLGSKVADAPEFAETYSYFTNGTTVTLMLLSSITLGVLIGAVSSMLAMERHLKLKSW
ncbi:MAG: cell division transport system permease protein [Candidatus Saccharimonadales bacterium]|jgi:cell division transport system permease protein